MSHSRNVDEWRMNFRDYFRIYVCLCEQCSQKQPFIQHAMYARLSATQRYTHLLIVGKLFRISVAPHFVAVVVLAKFTGRKKMIHTLKE